MINAFAISDPGRYRSLGVIAEHESGTLHLIEDTATGTQYCLKIISSQSIRDPYLAAVTTYDIDQASRLSHPNIASIYQIGVAAGQMHIVREFVPGTSLEQSVNKELPGINTVIESGLQIASAIDRFHKAGVVHGDIKPGNVIMMGGGKVKLVDFGLQNYRLLNARRSGLETLAETQAAYVAPEHFRAGAGRYSNEGDYYSLGGVLHKMVTGQPPSERSGQQSVVPFVMQKLRREQEEASARDITPLRTEAGEKLGRIIDHLLEPEPRRRLSSADDIISEFIGLKEGRGAAQDQNWRKILNEIEASYSPSLNTDDSILVLEKEPEPKGRQVNAWLHNAELPLVLNETYKLGVNIGAPRAMRLGGGAFKEPQWGQRDHIDLVISVAGAGVKVSPAWRHAVLPKHGEMKSVYFKITPLKDDDITLHLSIFLRRELTLLEEYSMELSVLKEPVEVGT
jgi:serine/threonine protein kinase